LIKELPSLVPSDDYKHSLLAVGGSNNEDSSLPPTSLSRAKDDEEEESSDMKQQHGDRTTEIENGADDHAAASLHDTTGSAPHPQHAGSMTKKRGEVAFFKLLHSEFKKASHFFDRATEEFAIREERVREGMGIMKQPNSIMVNEKWALMARSIYRLYRDLLLFETFAIMAYCSFSKILKKHDKMTGYCTRGAFMSNIVNKANFTYYPVVMAMINRCERLYEEVSENLLQEGNGSLYEDERLFINMIHRLNEQVLSSDDKDEVSAERIDAVKRPTKTMPSSENESRATSTLRSIVEENDLSQSPTKVADTAQSGNREDDDDDDSEDGCVCKKRAVPPSRATGNPAKKLRALL
jgi:hypothetical protein